MPNFLRSIRGYSNITLYESAATSNYNALQTTLTRRIAKGLFLGATYSWSKALTTASLDTSFVRIDQFTRAADYGPASYDVRQNFALNYVYEIPGMKYGSRIVRGVTSGWQVSGVTSIRTGTPFTPGFSVSGAGSANQTGSNSEGARIGWWQDAIPTPGRAIPSIG
jgi:hypothetical protein